MLKVENTIDKQTFLGTIAFSEQKIEEVESEEGRRKWLITDKFDNEWTLEEELATLGEYKMMGHYVQFGEGSPDTWTMYLHFNPNNNIFIINSLIDDAGRVFRAGSVLQKYRFIAMMAHNYYQFGYLA
jgi:hypothetical protein